LARATGHTAAHDEPQRSTVDPAVNLFPDPVRGETEGHVAQFYEDEGFLLDRLAAFIGAGLSAGDACVVIATEPHRRLLERRLQALEQDLDAARACGRYVAMDAAGALSRVMSNGIPDAGRFEEVIAEMVNQAARAGPRVRIYGEMVALLWAEGRFASAIAMERLWNRFREATPLILMCGYPVNGTDTEESLEPFTGICELHSRVIPAEGYTGLANADERLHAIVLLQRKARQLESEIAERKRTQEQLRVSEIHYRRLFEAAGDGVLILDVQTRRITDANPALARLLGVALHEIAGKELHEIGLFESPEAGLEFLRQLHDRQIASWGPVQLRKADGAPIEVECDGSIYQADGRGVVQCRVRDVTERGRADELNSHLAAIVESSDDAIVSKSLEGVILSWNRGAERIFGYRADEVIGRPIHILIPPERIAEEPRILERLKRGERIDHYETVRVAKDGRRVDISLTVSPIRDSRGRIFAASKIARDVTERRIVREALTTSEERMRQLLSLMPAAVYTCDLEGRITFYNLRAAELWGRSPDDGDTDQRFCGSYRLYHLDGSPVLPDETPMAEAVRTGKSARDREVVVERPDGSRIIASVNIDPLFDASGQRCGAINVFQDVSDRKRSEEALKLADRRKNEFLAMLAHELRNPLAPIRNAVQLLRRLGPQDPQLQHARDVIERQTQHMARLVGDLLDTARITRGKITLRREPLELMHVIGRAMETSRPLIEARRQHLAVSLPKEPVRLRGDVIRLAQVVSNLLSNAAKYTEEGGHIWLIADVEQGEIVVRVRDDGMGIPAAFLPYIFDLFTQAERSLDRSQGGLGIGLALVRSLVELHGGRVQAFSSGPGMGSEFVIYLPLLTEEIREPEVGRAVPRHSGLMPSAHHRVLVVDDNIDSAESMALLLKLGGHEVQLAHDGQAALDIARMFQPNVVLLDIGLPRMDGYEVARRLRNDPALQKTVLIALTGYGQAEDRRQSKMAGFDHHFIKPVDPEALEALINSMVLD
jgi:PAS domain S-box-containing protein